MKNTRFKLIPLLVWLVLCLTETAALGEIHIQLEPVAWTWEEKMNSTFQGSILTDGEEIKDAKLLLEIKTRLDDSGIVQFTHLNGQKLKIRKRGPAVEADLSGAQEGTTFAAEWLVPSSAQGSVSHAVVTLTVQDSDGNVLQTGTMEMGSGASEEIIAKYSPLGRVNQLMFWLPIACAVVWLLAIGRFLLIKRNLSRKG